MAQQNATINGTLIFTGTFAGQASIQAQPIGGNLIFQLPNQLPTVNQLLSVESVSGSVVTIGFAASQTAPSFSSITGSLALGQIAQGGATTNQVLEWNGTAWTPTSSPGSVPTLSQPGYFFPNPEFLFDVWDPSNIDPRAAGSLNNCTSWRQFYLPFAVTITRYAFRVDGGSGITGAQFFAGLYTASGALIFDIGSVDISAAMASGGFFGTGQQFDPGTKFFDSSRVAQSSITLAAGWYNYAWGCNVSAGSGTIEMPSMAQTSQLWDELIANDAASLPGGMTSRWVHSGSFDITGGHLPTTISSTGGAATAPANIVFFC